jgi:gamma-glutamylcyclotransferase (GGCT)/AIG2-like uncharacterized protein YtfP
MTLDRLFVYGTLRSNGSAFHMVADVVDRAVAAVLVDFALVGEGHRYPWCVESPGGEVSGEVLWIRSCDETLARLDKYEGVDGDNPEYRRVIAPVFTREGRSTAWVYVGGPGVPPDAGPVPGGSWMP